MISSSKKDYIVEYLPAFIRMVRVSSFNASPTIEAIEEVELGEGLEVIASSVRKFCGAKANGYLNGTCVVYPERWVVRQVVIDAPKGKETEFVFNFLHDQIENAPPELAAHCLSPKTGKEVDPREFGRKEVLICGVPHRDINELQQSMLEHAIYPKRLELGTVGILGAVQDVLKWNSLEEFEVKAEGISRGYSNLDTRLGNNTRGTENNTEDNFAEVDLSVGDASISGVPGPRSGQFVNNLMGQTLLDASTASDPNLQQSAIRNLTDLVHGGNLQRTTNAIFSTSQIGYIFSALKRQGNSRLVSHPTVVTLNNQEAEISIGEQFPIPNYQYNEERGSFEVAGFDYKDIGVILKVKPSVNNEGLITLKVNPEVSSRTGEREFGGASGASIPIISTRRTETKISLKDGYTMGLGGLLQASSIEEERKVPLLQKIPGLGAVFRNKEKDGQKMNLLIFITAKILSSGDSDFEDVFSQAQMEDVGLDPDEI